MMNNLFSMFDPCSSVMKTNMMIMTFLMNFIMFIKKKKNKIFTPKIMKEIKNNNYFNKKMMNLFVKNVFLIFMWSNLMNLIPYTFVITSSIMFNMTNNFTIWISITIYSISNFLKNMMIKMTPTGTPISIMPFMVIIELMSYMIRPLTLTLRLTANMVSGHILMMLMSKMLMKSILYMPLMYILSTLETSMALIQAFIIMTLMSLFINEIK